MALNRMKGELDLAADHPGRVTVFTWCGELGRFLAVLRRGNTAFSKLSRELTGAGKVVLFEPSVEGVQSVVRSSDPILLQRWKQDRMAGRLPG